MGGKRCVIMASTSSAETRSFFFFLFFIACVSAKACSGLSSLLGWVSLLKLRHWRESHVGCASGGAPTSSHFTGWE